jgi:protein-S-isoprenylcysteine O-methyltransferase Ste14
MQTLELKIPPPAVAILLALAMWGLAGATPLIEVPASIRIAAALALALAGSGFDLAGILAFRRARTTVNPFKPQNTAAIVTSGVYSITRNPMYVGMALVLLAWAVFLSAPWCVLGPLGFVLYITRFQIRPEEKMLAARFGSGFSDYQARVRRWL